MGLLVLLFVISMPGIVVAPSPIAANPHGGTVPFRATGAPGGFTLSGSVGSIEISLHNTMNVSTGTYQQPVFINSSADARWINANWSNGIAYYPSNDTPIYGWLESNATNTANSTLLWLRLDAIPAGGWTNVSIAFWPKSSFELSATGYMGEAPELSAQYAEFDNGASVFNFYDDFNGTTLASHWTGSTGWTYRVDDGFSVDSVPGSGSGIYSRSPYNSYPAVVDFYGDLYQTTSATHFVSEGLGTSACTGCYTAEAVAWAATGATYSGPSPQAAYFGSENFGTSAFSTQQAAVFTTEAVSSTEAIYEVNYTAAQTLTSNLPPGPLPVALAIAGYSPGLLTNNESTTWIRERTYVPFLPTVNVSAIEYPVTGAETGLPAGTPWWLNVTNGTSHLSRTPTFSFNESNGTYAYTVGTTNKTFAAPGGTFDVTGGPLVVPVTFHPVTYPVNFTETGLPPATGWLLVVSGAPLHYSVTPSTTVNFTNGSYAYTASSSNATYSAPPGGFRVSGGPANASVPFALLTFAIEFSESGLPMGTRWYAVILGGRSAPSTTENLSVNETNGTYAYTFAVADRSYAAPGGVVQVAGEAVSVSVIFARLTYPITFAETGLPRFTPWWLNASGTSPGLTTSGSITFEEPNGTYYYNASRPDRTYTTPSGSFTVSGSALTVPVAYGRVTFPVVFTESGLPSGRPWSVTLDGVLRTGTGNLEFASVWNGSHAFSVGAVSGYRSDPGNGSLVVQGALAAKAISFTANAVTFLGLPVVEGASLLGGLAAALVVVGVVFALRTRARRRRGGLGPTGPRAGPARPPGPGRTVRPGGPSPARPPRKAPPAPPAT